jgi:pyruvate/2-oxoglutarate/acetoin dehydrogenase E1 component
LDIVLKKVSYKNELVKSMQMLARNKRTIFLGQSVSYSGNSIYNTLIKVSAKKKIEMPVFEDVQMGMSIGLALNGFIPITCFPRFDFLILACNQLVNHLDKIQTMSNGQFNPKIIIRTSVGSKKPLDGGPQHTQDYTDVFKKILTEVEVIYLNNPNKIYQIFKTCINPKIKKSYLIVENGDFYNAK